MRPALAALALTLAALPAAAAERFTLTTVGDLIMARPLSMLAQPGAFPEWRGFADALALLKRGDLTYGNMESTIVDIRKFDGYPYSWDGDWMLSSLPSVAADLRSIGIGIASRANNHALDWGPEGMRSTGRWLALNGIAAAGTGETAAEATAPGYGTVGGRKVAIVSMVSTYRPTTNALDPGPAVPYGRPGANGLTVEPVSLVDDSSYAELAAIACRFQAARPCPTGAAIDLFGTAIRQAQAGETPYTYQYRVEPQDLDRILAAIRTAKEGAGFVLATIHAHEPLTDEAAPDTWQDPAAFLRDVAHKAIEAGADIFVTTGIHHVAGVEIYRGRPILYGLGNFFWSDIQEPLSAELYQSSGNQAALAEAFAHPERATDQDLGLTVNAGTPTFAPKGETAQNRTFQTMVVRSTYDRDTGSVTELRLYPIELGYGEKLSRSGIPRRAGDRIAGLVLDRVAALSPGLTLARTREDGYETGVVAVGKSR